MPYKSCICGAPIHVRPTDTEVSCRSCGSVFDVLVHGSTSPEVGLTASKIPTGWEGVELRLTKYGASIVGTSQFLGTTIWCRGLLYEDKAGFPGYGGAATKLERSVNGGAWTKIGDRVTDGFGEVYFSFVLNIAGSHKYRLVFGGDATHLGSPSKSHGLAVNYAVSPEVGVVASPALTIIVKDAVTKKLIEGAHVLVDTFEAFTDVEGKAVFDAIPPGTYEIWAEAKDYKPVTFKPAITLTEVGMVVEIGLWPLWSIALGGVATASVIMIGAFKALGRT